MGGLDPPTQWFNRCVFEGLGRRVKPADGGRVE
jgi:hypothetical protein